MDAAIEQRLHEAVINAFQSFNKTHPTPIQGSAMPMPNPGGQPGCGFKITDPNSGKMVTIAYLESIPGKVAIGGGKPDSTSLQIAEVQLAKFSSTDILDMMEKTF